MSDSVPSHRRQPTRLPGPWDSPGKNTGVGCHFLLQCIQVKSESEVAQSCPTLSDPMGCSLPGSSVHGIFQARVLEWGATAFSTNAKYVNPCFSLLCSFFAFPSFYSLKVHTKDGSLAIFTSTTGRKSIPNFWELTKHAQSS